MKVTRIKKPKKVRRDNVFRHVMSLAGDLEAIFKVDPDHNITLEVVDDTFHRLSFLVHLHPEECYTLGELMSQFGKAAHNRGQI